MLDNLFKISRKNRDENQKTHFADNTMNINLVRSDLP